MCVKKLALSRHFVVARVGSFEEKCLTLQRNGANHSPGTSIMKQLLKKVTDLIVKHSAAKVWLFTEKDSIQVTLWDHDDQYKFDFYDFAKKEWKRTYKCLSEFITIIEQKGGVPC
jgi:hypothetical protein